MPYCDFSSSWFCFSQGESIRLNDLVLFRCESKSDVDHVYLSCLDQLQQIVTASSSKTSGIRIKLFATFDTVGDAFKSVIKVIRWACAQNSSDYDDLWISPVSHPFNPGMFSYHLQGGDYVRVYHQESNGLLSLKSNKNDKEVYLSTEVLNDLTTRHPFNRHDASSLWLVEVIHFFFTPIFYFHRRVFY